MIAGIYRDAGAPSRTSDDVAVTLDFEIGHIRRARYVDREPRQQRFQLHELLSQAEIGTLAMITGAKVDPKRGHIALGARDCDFTPASAVAVTVDQMNVDEQSLTFYLINGIPAATAMATDASGIATVFNLMTSPLGSLAVVSATAGAANGKKLGSVSVIIRPGTLTTFALPPEP